MYFIIIYLLFLSIKNHHKTTNITIVTLIYYLILF